MNNQVMIIEAQFIRRLHFDSKRFNCIISIFEEHLYHGCNIMNELSHLYGLHIISTNTSKSHHTLTVGPLMNKPIIRMANKQVCRLCKYLSD